MTKAMDLTQDQTLLVKLEKQIERMAGTLKELSDMAEQSGTSLEHNKAATLVQELADLASTGHDKAQSWASKKGAQFLEGTDKGPISGRVRSILASQSS